MSSRHDAIRATHPGGDLTVSLGVLLDLVSREVSRAPGVVRLGRPERPGPPSLRRAWSWLLRLLAPSRVAVPRGVAIELGEGEVAVSLELVARARVDLVALSTALRERVRRAVEGTTGLAVRCVDVAVVALGPDEVPPPLDASSEARRRYGLAGREADAPSRQDERRRGRAGDSRA